MSPLLWIIFATLIIGAISLVGALTLLIKEGVFKRLVHPLVAFSAGALIGGAMLHLLPESVENFADPQIVFLMAIAGFSLFFLLEQFIHWHHCHQAPSEHKHPVTYMILISDTVHNFLDGVAIGSAFIIDIKLGIATTLAVALHEIPQEMGDFGILVHGGWKKSKALLFNFATSLSMLVGGLLVWFLGKDIDVRLVLPLTAGSFIYIAASDLIPEVKHHGKLGHNALHFASFALGIILMWALTNLE